MDVRQYVAVRESLDALVSLFAQVGQPLNIPLSFLVERTVGHRKAPCTTARHVNVNPEFGGGKQGDGTNEWFGASMCPFVNLKMSLLEEDLRTRGDCTLILLPGSAVSLALLAIALSAGEMGVRAHASVISVMHACILASWSSVSRLSLYCPHQSIDVGAKSGLSWRSWCPRRLGLLLLLLLLHVHAVIHVGIFIHWLTTIGFCHLRRLAHVNSGPLYLPDLREILGRPIRLWQIERLRREYSAIGVHRSRSSVIPNVRRSI